MRAQAGPLVSVIVVICQLPACGVGQFEHRIQGRIEFPGIDLGHEAAPWCSTGGFTDCLLQRGAAHVVAVDVGYGQLAQKLRDDPRVTNLERTNARALTPEDIGGAADLSVVDASFIGLAKLVDGLARCTRAGGTLVALVKPQFEVGMEASRGKGVVRDEAVRAGAIADARLALENAGFEVLAEADCVIFDIHFYNSWRKLIEFNLLPIICEKMWNE